MPVRRPAAVLAALVCAVALAGCLGEDPKPAEDKAIKGNVLTLYSSLPAHGPAAGVAEAVAAGQRQALADARGRAGRYRIRFVQLPSTKPGSGIWDPGQVAENAARAVRDPRTAAYLGELNLGASAVSVPVTNDGGLLQVSPGDGLTSLTRRPPGRSAAGAERYYPTERRNFLRLVPEDLSQAKLIVKRMEALGVDRPALVVGTGVYARELASQLAAEARAAGIEPVETKDLRDDAGTARGDREIARDMARDLAEVGPDAVVLAMARGPGTAALLASLGRALPQARLLTGSGVLVGQPLVAATSAPAPSPLEAIGLQHPHGPAALRTLRRIARDQDLEAARPEALWGYESVRVVLDAIEAAQRTHVAADAARGTGTHVAADAARGTGEAEPVRRADIIRAALTPRTRRSPIGKYEVRRTGAVQGLPLALYRLDGDRFEFVSTLR